MIRNCYHLKDETLNLQGIGTFSKNPYLFKNIY
jgi:hypothetical protein